MTVDPKTVDAVARAFHEGVAAHRQKSKMSEFESVVWAAGEDAAGSARVLDALVALGWRPPEKAPDSRAP
jgi:predicted dinucleotide-binding enzyme